MNKFVRLGIVGLVLVSIVGGVIGTAIYNNRETEREQEQVDETLQNVSGDLSIRVWEGGYGSQYVYNVADGFKKKFPKVNITIKPTAERQVVYGEIVGFNKEYDIFFNESILFKEIGLMEPLDDVYSYKWNGEEKTIGEKMDPMYYNAYYKDGHHYFINAYTGAWGLMYQNSLVDSENLPVTTDELIQVCEGLKGQVAPIIFAGGQATDYWTYAYYNLLAQYEGINAWNLYQLGMTPESNGEYDPASAYPIGMLRALEAVEELLWYPNAYIHPQSTGYQYIVAQKKFLDGEAAFMWGGSWMLNEMQDLYPDGKGNDVEMMKMPVISSVVEKCTSITGENGGTADQELAALIRAIDAGSTALSGDGYSVTQADYDKIYEARNVVYVNGESATAIIPKVAQNKELAKLFLKYMYSDEGIKLYTNTKHCAVLPVQGYEYLVEEMESDLDLFQKSSYNIMFSCSKVFNNYNNPVLGLSCLASQGGGTLEIQFGSQKSVDRTTALATYNERKNLWSSNDSKQFYDLLRNKGLIE